MQVWMYKRDAEVGDIVYHDGTYSDIANKLKSPIGICFYIDPDDKSRRLMVALQSVGTNANSMQHCLGIATFNVTLADNPTVDVHDIRLPDHIVSDSLIMTKPEYLDSKQPDGFKKFDDNDCLSDIGFLQLEEDYTYNGKTYNKGEFIPRCWLNTTGILKMRDMVLEDPNVNLRIPAATSTQSVYDNLVELLGDIVKSNGNNYDYEQYYYPAASLCFAYEPTVGATRTLKDCFKAGNWALPALGDLVRLGYHSLVGNMAERFTKWYNAGYFTPIDVRWNGSHWSSTKNRREYNWYVQFVQKQISSVQPISSKWFVRPVAAF